MMEPEIEDEEPKRGVWIYFVALLLIILMVVWVIPTYVIKPDPRPQRELSLEDVKHLVENVSVKGYSSVGEAKDSVSVKGVANFIASESCPNGHKVCYAKALHAFVRDNINYINDPVILEYVQTPMTTLATGGGDCDDGTVLLASLLGAIGISTEWVHVPNHVLLRAWMPDAARQYKQNGDWVYMDWTCGSCEFGEIP